MSYKQDRADVSLDILALELSLEPLGSRRLFYDINFVYKLLNGKLSCPEFLRKIYSKIPTFNSKNNGSFLIPHCSANITKNSPEYRLLEGSL